MIMINNLNEALVSMGYRKLEPNKPFWLKPFCFSVIAVRVENNHVIMRLLYNYNNKTEIWSESVFDIEDDNNDILRELKLSECELIEKYNPEIGSMNTNFEFLSIVDQANLF